MTRPFDFGQAANDGISVLPALPPLPVVGDVLTVASITAGVVQLAYGPGGGGTTGAYLPLAGGTLTGPLMLAADPAVDLEAGTKHYTDTKVSTALATVSGSYLALAGGTMTGSLFLPAAAPTNPVQAATKGYVDSQVAAIPAGVTTFNTRAGVVTLTGADVSGATGLLVSGGTMTGVLALAADPTADPQAATKHYVDYQVGAVAAAGVTAIYYSARTTVTTASDPGSGHVQWNVPMSPPSIGVATEIYISGTSSQNVDWTLFWAGLQVGQRIVIEDRTDHTQVARWLIAGTVVNHGSWLTIPVSPYGPLMNLSWVNNQALIVAVVGIGGDQYVPIEQARNTARLQAQWVTGAIVANDTVWLAYDAPYAGTINSLTYFTGNGSFTVAIQINGVSVTGLGAVAVSSATPATTNATAARTFTAGQRITAVIAAATGSPTDALLSLAVTWS
jgi:hypothetical protein